MEAVLYRLRRGARTHRWATVRLTVVVAVVSGVVLALAMGAQRTATAPDRYQSSQPFAPDATVTQEAGPPRTAEVAALPGVASAESITFVFGALLRPGSTDALDSLVFAGSEKGTGEQVVEGRPARSGRDELVVNRTFVDAFGASLGDRFDLVTLTQEQADRDGFDVADPAGPQRRATLVGIVDGPAELNAPTPVAVLPPSVLDEPGIGVSATIIAVSSHPGVSRSELRRQLDGLPDGTALSLEPAVFLDPSVRRAIDAQSEALWVLTLVALAAALVVIGQLSSRHARRSDAERGQLSALGFTSRQVMAEALGWVVVAVVVGSGVGAGLATLGSVAFPSGFVRPVEPDPGIRVEPWILVGGVALLIAIPLLWTSAGLVLEAAAPRRRAPRPILAGVAARMGSATTVTGVRFAFLRGSRDTGSPRGAVLGLAATAAVLIGTLVFGSSLDRLMSDPARSGTSYDLQVGDSGADTLLPEVRTGLDADPDVAALMLYAQGTARVGGSTIGLVAMEPVKGELAPTVLSGRLPSSDDEIALGRLEARDLGVGIGDEVTLRSGGRRQRASVTGLAVVPSVAGVDGVGQDGVVTLAGLHRLDPDREPVSALVRISTDAPPAALARLGRTYGGDPSGPSLPESMTNLTRVRSMPDVLAGLLVGLTVLTVLHVMLVSVRNRRRDVAVLRAMGADRHWTARVLHWQVSALVLVPVAIGMPLGLVGGHLVFRAFADSMGTVDDASIPFVSLVALVVVLLVLANVVALVPTRRAGRLTAASSLAPE